MQRGILETLLRLVLGTCTLCGVAFAQGDPNALWDPAEHFLPYWESVELEARIYNPAARPDEDPNTQRQLRVQGAVEMIDYAHLLGVSTQMRGVVVLDQDEAEIYNTQGQDPPMRWYRETEDVKSSAGFGERADEFNFSVSIPMDPSKGYPTSLSRIQWSVGALVAETFEVVDVPFEPNEEWIELVPGLEILLEEASVEQGRYAYKIQAIYDPDSIDYSSGSSWHFRNDDAPPATMLIDMDMLNAAGQSVHDLSASGASGGSSSGRGTSDGLMEVTSTGSGSCSACGDVTTIRYTFALAPYEVEARLALEDVPVPGF